MSSVRISDIDIFQPNENASKNACVGENGQHDFQTYAEGYLHAASRLIKSVKDNDFDIDTDVLVHPILYCVRHAIELSIKHAMEELSKTDIKIERKNGHGLLDLWNEFKIAAKNDRRLVNFANNIDHFISQLDNADPEGQDFRYPIKVDGGKTLIGKSIVDMHTLEQTIILLGQEIKDLFRLLPILTEERHLKAYTKKFNREELRELSLELPPLSTWSDSAKLKEVRERWKTKFSISNTDFSEATQFITCHREFAGNLEKEIPLLFIDDELILLLVSARYEIDLQNRKDSGVPMFDLILRPSPYPEVFNSLENKLTVDVVADITAIFYLSSYGYFSESYEKLVANYQSELIAESKHSKEALKRGFVHIFSKTTFNRHFIRCLKKLGQINVLATLPIIEN